ncbi:MAG TPA: universal stress protein [Vicinamibacterales bacterium]|nr:universal stress protein [Vicinamibacterales bacterium]
MIDLKQILVATDFSEPAEAAVRYGIELCRRFGARLHLVHVVSDVSSRAALASGMAIDFDQVQREIEEGARQQLEALLPEPDRSALGATLVVIPSTSPAHAILSYARDAQVDLIVTGTHGRKGVAHFFFGSVAQQITREAACPVLTTGAHRREFLRPDALAVVPMSV